MTAETFDKAYWVRRLMKAGLPLLTAMSVTVLIEGYENYRRKADQAGRGDRAGLLRVCAHNADWIRGTFIKWKVPLDMLPDGLPAKPEPWELEHLT